METSRWHRKGSLKSGTHGARDERRTPSPLLKTRGSCRNHILRPLQHFRYSGTHGGNLRIESRDVRQKTVKISWTRFLAIRPGPTAHMLRYFAVGSDACKIFRTLRKRKKKKRTLSFTSSVVKLTPMNSWYCFSVRLLPSPNFPIDSHISGVSTLPGIPNRVNNRLYAKSLVPAVILLFIQLGEGRREKRRVAREGG